MQVNNLDVLSPLMLLAADTKTASYNGSGVDILGYDGQLKFILQSGAGGAGATMDVKITTSDTQGGAYADVEPSAASFAQIGNAADVKELHLNVRQCRRWIRAEVTIAGTASFKHALIAVGVKKFQ